VTQAHFAPRIFIADDSREIRDRLAELFSTLRGVVVAGVATDVPSAEQSILQTRPDLAILDLQMPGGAVLDLIPRLRGKLPRLRIAVLSTHAADYRERALAAGADYVLQKAREIHRIEEIARALADDLRLEHDMAEARPAVGTSMTSVAVVPRVVLNVDDYKPSLYARTRILRRAGFEVIEASTGGDALRLAARHKPQILLLDVHLPDMSGIEVCRRIKAGPEGKTVTVVHVSATYRTERDRADNLRASGADAYLTEPVPAEELIGVIERLVGGEPAERS
jgi:CheY-like chemotaxis protein